MVPSAAGAVMLLPFPFSDLSQSKLRPAVVLADAGRGDWVLCQVICQVTSKPYGDPAAVILDATDFSAGSLRVQSFARPGKLFTANDSLFSTEVGTLTPTAFGRLLSAVVTVLRP
jgi:mRNA interferase MazF